MDNPSLTLNSGNKIPLVGLGTWKSKVNEVEAAVECAIDCGYRHIDGAWVYDNEQEVGNAIAKKIKEGKVNREDLFVVSKLWIRHFEPEDVRPHFMDSLKKLQLDCIDLYLMHFPAGFKKEKDANGLYPPADVDYVDTWKELEKLKKDGLVRDIGVSNFNEYQLNRIMKEASVVPAVNQIESHPYLTQKSLIEFCQKNKIVVTAYSPLGCSDFPGELKHSLLQDPKVKEIAVRLNKTVAQVVLRYQTQRNVIVIPKSVTPSRIKENLQIFDFKLSDEDMNIIGNLDINYRICNWSNPGYRTSEHKYFPFKENYSEGMLSKSP